MGKPIKESQQEVVAYVEAHPGTTIQEMCVVFSALPGTVNCWLNAPRILGLIHNVVRDRKCCWFPGARPRAPMCDLLARIDAVIQLRESLRKPTRLDLVYEVVASNPGIRALDIAAKLNIPLQKVRVTLSALVSKERILRVYRGGQYQWGYFKLC